MSDTLCPATIPSMFAIDGVQACAGRAGHAGPHYHEFRGLRVEWGVEAPSSPTDIVWVPGYARTVDGSALTCLYCHTTGGHRLGCKTPFVSVPPGVGVGGGSVVVRSGTAAAPDLVALIRQVEWAGTVRCGPDADPCCPWCRAVYCEGLSDKYQRHASDCPIVPILYPKEEG